MLGDIPGAANIYIITGYTDMRKSIDGLCAIVMAQLKEVTLLDRLYHSFYMSIKWGMRHNTIRNLTGEYKKIELDCREGVRAQLERMKELCKERNSLYEKQNELKEQKWRIEKPLER